MKEAWQEEHPGNTNEWPAAEQLVIPNKILRSYFGEIYIINRTGEPPCVYFPPNVGGEHAGQLLCIKSNMLVPLQSK